MGLVVITKVFHLIFFITKHLQCHGRTKMLTLNDFLFLFVPFYLLSFLCYVAYILCKLLCKHLQCHGRTKMLTLNDFLFLFVPFYLLSFLCYVAYILCKLYSNVCKLSLLAPRNSSNNYSWATSRISL